MSDPLTVSDLTNIAQFLSEVEAASKKTGITFGDSVPLWLAGSITGYLRCVNDAYVFDATP